LNNYIRVNENLIKTDASSFSNLGRSYNYEGKGKIDHPLVCKTNIYDIKWIMASEAGSSILNPPFANLLANNINKMIRMEAVNKKGQLKVSKEQIIVD
jgi:hypothetical protein